MRAIYSILLLVVSNSFMTLAWYGHLKFKDWGWFSKAGVITLILVSWAIAFFEYCFQVPANRIGFDQYGGPFNMIQLKVIQEVVSLLVFSFFAVVVFKQGTLQWNHLLGFFFIVLAVYFVFKK